MTAAQRAVRCAFFLWVSLINLVGVATVWARASDVFVPEASARLFGILGAGATLGARAWLSLAEERGAGNVFEEIVLLTLSLLSTSSQASTPLPASAGQLVASLLAAGVARLPVFRVGGVSLAPMLLSAACFESAGQLAARVTLTPAATGELE